MASNCFAHGSLEIRKLDYLHKDALAKLLDCDGAWKILMTYIPTTFRPTRSGPQDRRFNYDDISVIEQATQKGDISAAQLLLDEWGTMGEFRPTVQDLLELCTEIKQIRVASYISEKILGGSPIEAPKELDYDDLLETDLNFINSDSYTTSTTTTTDYSDVIVNPSPMTPENTLKTHEVKFNYLFSIANGFSEDRLLGVGGFSRVYLGVTHRRQMGIAIKLMNNNKVDAEIMQKQLNYEIDQLPRLRHPNIIELLGFSNDVLGRACLLYPFMSNGTLDGRLKVAEGSPLALTADQRWIIAHGLANGLDHLHSQKKVLVHRDVKPSNVLLSETFVPKLADFGLLRYGVSGDTDTATITQNVHGTMPYMPPEAFRGDISVKIDVWSYGVVVMQLISGWPVIDRKRGEPDLVTHVRNLFEDLYSSQVSLSSSPSKPDPEINLINAVMDSKANWDHQRAKFLFDISFQDCIVDEKTKRTTMKNILKKFSTFSSQTSNENGIAEIRISDS